MIKHYQISLEPHNVPGSPDLFVAYLYILHIKQIHDSEEKVASEWSKYKAQAFPIVDFVEKKLIIATQENLNFYLTSNGTFTDRCINDIDDMWNLLSKGSTTEYKTIELYLEGKLELHSNYDTIESMEFRELGIKRNVVYLPPMRYKCIIENNSDIELENVMVESMELIERLREPDKEQSLNVQSTEVDVLMGDVAFSRTLGED